jgi:hypothetical protein
MVLVVSAIDFQSTNKNKMKNTNKMEIKLRNDGKQKAQSCEAKIELGSKNQGWGNFNAEFSGWGADGWSAETNLIQQVDELILELQKLKSSV